MALISDLKATTESSFTVPGQVVAQTAKLTTGAGVGKALISDADGVGTWTDPDTLSLDHGSLAGLSDDDHAQYLLLAGRTPTQAVAGDINFGDATLGILDTNASHHLRLDCGSDLSADRILTFTPGDAARTITLSGNPTLNDWFDQSVKVASSPTFAGATIGALEGIVKASSGTLGVASLGAGLGYDGINFVCTIDGIDDLTSKSHTLLTDIGTLTHATIDSYLDQAVKTTSSPTFAQITAPLIIGGTGTTDDLILRTTSGVGASGADMIFQTGNNGGTEAMRILYDGKVGIGTAAPTFLVHIRKDVASALGPTLCLENQQYASAEGSYSAIRFQHYASPARYSEIRGHTYGTTGKAYAVVIGITDPDDVFRNVFTCYYDNTMIGILPGRNGYSSTHFSVQSSQIVTSGTPTIYGIGLSSSVTSKITTGYTNAGYLMGADLNVLRYDQGGTIDKGTLTNAFGLRILSGHYGSEGTKTTTLSYGINVPFYIQTGTVGTWYGIYMNRAATGGTVTNTSYWIYVDSNYNCYRGGSSSWDTTSDSKMKTNIQPSSNGLNIIRQLNVKTFNWNGKCGHKDTTTEQVGILADELAIILPEATFKVKHQTPPDPMEKEKKEKGEELRPLDEDDGEEYWGYNMDRIHFAMINSIKELDQRLSLLEPKP
jgi:hypothetical protein